MLDKEPIKSPQPDQPKMTVGICDNCKRLGFDEWGEPYCLVGEHKLVIDIPEQETTIRICVEFKNK